MLKQANYCIPFLLVACIITGCQNYKATTSSANIKLPVTFTGNADTLSIARLPIKDFFTDPYLISLIDTAIAANPDILTAVQRIEIAKANVRYNASQLLPQINAAANAGVEKYGDYTMNGVGNYDTNFSPNINGDQRIPNPVPNYFLGFQSSWEVDLWGKLNDRKKAAYARFLASHSGYRLVITSLTSQIAQLYYQLLALDTELKIIRKNIALQDKALEIVKIQKQGGRATELAVQQFQAQLLRTKSLEYQTQQQVKETENQLNFFTGNFDKPVKRDTSITSAKLPGLLAAGIPAQLLLNRPDIQAAELELAAMNADIRVARKNFLPALTLTPYLGYNAFKSALLFNPGSFTYGILGGITAPIFNRKMLKADLERTIAESKVALYNYQKTILAGFQEVSNGLNGIENYNQLYLLKQQELQSLNNALSVANDLYLVGRANYLEIITAQQSVLDAELGLANTKRNIFSSAINLYQAVGGGWR
ncbi:efflux transporter outer membrane subunit [Mucilaginibacter limnophilus]|uniref:Efflux transporter outer membrane subunit n=1 Tax=Mucilaginibacter limnophilus TaxID=1932778 RepID=A0A3S2UZS3_9SPHI|nr:efflux transporter outer membrane subunit [Mucilaginibacter limnophilus]RVT97370.1 efflux transporter outer membrane subunit [Mucilaginibacter limnophilus]